jgi:hypothetical protein
MPQPNLRVMDWAYGLCAIILVVVAIWAIFHVVSACARDVGQWEERDPEVRAWFQSLRQPDQPGLPCCGESDGYWCDDVHVRDGHTYCIVDDDRDDEPLHRPHVPVGTEILIPDNKIGNYPGNPVGHNIVFMGVTRGLDNAVEGAGYVYCYVQGAGG